MNTPSLARTIAITLTAMLPLALAAGCGNDEDPKTYILVHGAFQDSSVWGDVVPLLEDDGHTVVTVDLPGRGSDTTPHGEITLADHVATVSSAVDAQEGQVVLVGHSFGGITISQVAENNPGKIAKLVYLAGYLPENGGSLAGYAEEDMWNGFNENNFIISPDYTTASVLADDRLTIFCGDCDPATQQRFLADFHDEPLGPLAEGVAITAANFGSVSKAYIKTLKDNAISAMLQDILLDRTAVQETYELDTSHQPFLTQPVELADILSSIEVAPAE